MIIIKKEKGQAMTEVALTLPLFVLILAVLIQLWFMTVRKQQTHMATRHSARALTMLRGKWGSLDPYPAGKIRAEVKNNIYKFQKTRCDNDELEDDDMVFSPEQQPLEPNGVVKSEIQAIELLTWNPLIFGMVSAPGLPTKPYKSTVDITYHQAVIGSWSVARKVFDGADGNNDGLIDLKDKYSMGKQY